jgi:O-antigen biosynthesis protein
MSTRARVFAMVSMQRSWEYSSYAIKTFAKNTPFNEQDVFILLDDGSFGGAPDWVLPRVEVLTHDKPRTLAENMNAGLAVAREREADFYFIHNDTIFPQGWIDAFLAERPSIIVPITNQDIEYETSGFVWAAQLILTDYSKRAPFLREVMKMNREKAIGFRPLLSAPFVCVKIPYQVYQTVGDFDVNFGRVGAEDRDYCLRAIEAGYSVEQATDSYVLHFGSKSTAGGGEKLIETQARVAQYLRVFEEKWGSTLKQLVFDSIDPIQILSSEATEMLNQAEFRKLIGLIKGK